MADMITRPGPGWEQQTKGPVWAHKNGWMIHVSGLIARSPSPHGQIVDGVDYRDKIEKLIKINGGNRKRGLMAWAMNLAERRG
ncbi:MAG: hypothetical protein GY799_13390 [Desulfobulbaceae bacterium]|nr:hypothetical protein [Desulfobulbaceae bacterium]